MMFTNVDVIHQDDVPTSKPLLAFKHNPKAGGGSIFILLSEMKTRNNTYLANFLKESTYCTSHPNVKTKKKSMEEDSLYCQKEICVNSAKCKYSFLDLAERNDALMYIKEFDTADPIIQQRAFVVSSIREPCDQFLSLWAYGSSGRGALHRNVDGYGIDAPYFDSPRDIDAFRHTWLRHPIIKGRLARRHHKYFGENHFQDMIKDKLHSYPVDCWVYVDDFQSTLYSCLREYEIQGGHVNWTAPLLSNLVREIQVPNSTRGHLQNENIQSNRSNYTKNDPLHDIRENHHSKCTKYFDKETATFIRFGDEEFIYNEFGYTGCCGGRERGDKLIAPPPLADEFGFDYNDEKNPSKPLLNGISNNSRNSVRNTSLAIDIDEVVELEETNYHLHVAVLFLLLAALVYFRKKAMKSHGSTTTTQYKSS
mmetsp:Transcript_28303/g.58803  ORF Transcript_28303/g.58803 Transcript_28303/m.58803 type:complete len:423 (+) Transcript_28303:120-1388(+)